MHKYDREKDRLIIKLEAAEKAYMSLLYDYTELKEDHEKLKLALEKVQALLNSLMVNDGYKSLKKEEDDS